MSPFSNFNFLELIIFLLLSPLYSLLPGGGEAGFAAHQREAMPPPPPSPTTPEASTNPPEKEWGAPGCALPAAPFKSVHGGKCGKGEQGGVVYTVRGVQARGRPETPVRSPKGKLGF